MARKLKLSLLLPAVQVVTTGALIIWSDRVDWMLMGGNHRAPGPHVRVHLFVIFLRRIWSGVNAPTFPFCFATGVPLPLVGIGVGEMLYLLAVTLVWFCVGRCLDHKRGLEVHEIRAFNWRELLFRLLTVGWGMFLLLWNASTLDDAFPVLFLGGRLFRPEVVIARTLFLLWSVFLVVVPGAKLTQEVRRWWSTPD